MRNAALGNLGSLEPGPLAAWVSALLTTGTLFMSLRLYRRDYESRRRDQARKINAWPVSVDAEQRTITVKLSNSSDEPAYDVHILVNLLVSDHPFYYDWHASLMEYALGPSKEPEEHKTQLNLPLPDACSNPPISIPKMAVELVFTDTSGTTWTRDPAGRLKVFKKRHNWQDRFIMWHQFKAGKRLESATKKIYEYLTVTRVWEYNPDRLRWRQIKHPNPKEYDAHHAKRLEGLTNRNAEKLFECTTPEKLIE